MQAHSAATRLTICGILAPALFVAMSLLVGLLWEGYSAASQTVSELSAIGAPTRQLWNLLGTIYVGLMVAFGWSVWRTVPSNRALRVVGVLVMAQAVFGYFWPPMHQRAVLAAGGGSLTDTLQIAWTIVSGLLFMSIIATGAAARGRRFRIYSIATLVVLLITGGLTGTYASRIEADLPTPWAGAWERINIAAYMLWVAVLATQLMRSLEAGYTLDAKS